MGKRISDWWGRIRPAVGTAYERDSGHVEHTHRVVTVHDAVGPGSPTDKVSWGMRCEHHGGSGNTPDKVAAAVSHPSGGSTVRGKIGGGSSMFQGGGRVRWPRRAATRSWK
jgi:hypothetical protein